MMWRDRQFLFLAIYILGTAPSHAAGPVAAPSATQQMSPSEAATVSEFVATCDGNISMCEYKMRMAVLNKINTRNSASICITDAHPQKRVTAWLSAHPETHKMATEDGLYEAYKNLYPCP